MKCVLRQATVYLICRTSENSSSNLRDDFRDFAVKCAVSRYMAFGPQIDLEPLVGEMAPAS